MRLLCLSPLLLVIACAGDDPAKDGTTPTECEDADNDGVCDEDDVCAGGDDAADADGDGIPDDCEETTNPDCTGPDSDGDGVCDEDDLCEGDDAAGDTDDDGVCDDVDDCPLDGGPAVHDDDGDGVCDSDDACFGDNASGDADADGVCDNADPCPLDGPPGDSDGDGSCDSDDRCPFDPADSCFFDCVVNMDDAWFHLGEQGDPNVYYGPYGLTFDNGVGYGLISGAANGDLTNWDVQGSNGAAAWGLWPGPHGITFDVDVYDVSLDFLRAFYDVSITVDAYHGGVLVDSVTLDLVDWLDVETASFAGPIDTLVWEESGAYGYFNGYGVDNLRYGTYDTCPPVLSSCALNFEDALVTLGEGADPTAAYSAYGVAFDNYNGFGIIGGVGNGDFGNWAIEGSNGSAAWGQWPGAHGIAFGADVLDLSVDFLRGHDDVAFEVLAWRGGVLVDSEYVSLSGPHDTYTARFYTVVDEITWDVYGFFGVDNVRYRTEGTCPLEVVSCTLDMDAAWAANGQGSDPTAYYGTYGLTFDNAYGYGLIGGVGNGDPGNWSIEGSNGSAAWGLWEGEHGIGFGTVVHGVSLDFLRGYTDYDFTVYALLGEHMVGRAEVSLVGAFDVETVSFPGPVDQVVWYLNGIIGLDNLRFEGSCPQ